MKTTHLIKRKGHKERFDEKKVYGSVYAACYVADMQKKQCEKTAKEVAKEIKKLVDKGKITTSNQIFRAVPRLLRKRKHGDAAFMYETHRDVS